MKTELDIRFPGTANPLSITLHHSGPPLSLLSKAGPLPGWVADIQDVGMTTLDGAIRVLGNLALIPPYGPPSRLRPLTGGDSLPDAQLEVLVMETNEGLRFAFYPPGILAVDWSTGERGAAAPVPDAGQLELGQPVDGTQWFAFERLTGRSDT